MKEHLGPITGLRMRSNDEEVASSSGDGSIIIWCLKKFIRRALILQDTLFLDVAWHPAECQVSADGQMKNGGFDSKFTRFSLIPGRWSHA